jgi:diguanylate cyclase (GGDEF)-like protein/PAS domain S-box-containing protein
MMAAEEHPRKDTASSQDAAAELRRGAEQRLDQLADADGSFAPADVAAAVHELRVHQVELEMQNEELRIAQLDLDDQREKYYDLFDRAPVGYLTLSDKGVVGQANLTAAHLLGVERQLLVGQPFSAFVHTADRDGFYLHQRGPEKNGEQRVCELRLVRMDPDRRSDSDTFWARIESRPQFFADGTPPHTWMVFTDISRTRRAEDQLTYVMKAVQSASDAIGISDAQGHHIFQNEALSTLLEFETAEDLEAAGGGQSRVKDPEVAREMYEWILSARPWAGELELITKSGRVFPAYERADAIVDEEGEVIGLVGIITDISERKRAESELNRERALLAQAERIGHIGSWRLCPGGEARWSEEAVRILGFLPPSDDGDGFEALRCAVHPDCGVDFEKWVMEVFASREPCRGDFRIVRPNGDTRWICAHGQSEEGEAGGPALVAGILHDVTESKQDEQLRVEGLEQVANVDRLTGLHNLRGFDLVAEQAIAQAERAKQGIGLIFCDMDGLKSINDAFGHAQGDRALQDATSILKFTLRNADAIARIGGDEFVVLAVGGDSQSVLSLNERLQEGFEFFNSTNERPYQLSMSAGTAWCEPGGPCSLEALKVTADAEMYVEKTRRGRPAKVAPSPAE